MTKPVKQKKKAYKPLTFEDVKKAIDSMPKPETILDTIKICNKHWKIIEKQFEIKDTSNLAFSSISGVKVIVKPYLKKVRLYYRKP